MPTVNQEKTAFVDDQKLYNKTIQSVPAPEKSIGIDVDQELLSNIVQQGIANNLDISSLNSFLQVGQSRDQIYALIDNMSEDSIVASALELYTEDATEYNSKGQIVWCESNDADIAKYVQFLLDSMNVDKNTYGWMYSLIKYGDLYLKLYRESDYEEDDLFEDQTQEKKNRKPLNEDIKVKANSVNDHYTHYIEKEPNPAEMFELTKLGKSYAYIKADLNTAQTQSTGIYQVDPWRYNFKQQDITIHEATDFVHACLEDNSSRTPEEVNLFLSKDSTETENKISYKVKRGQPLLYNLFRIWRLLKLLENAMILNRVTKSSSTKIVQVEVGDMPKEQVGPHLQGVKSLMEQKSAIDTGNSISEYTNPGPTENNIYVPTRGGIGNLSLQTIGGDTNVSGLADIDYFKNLFYGALGIPKQYLGDTDDATGFNGGTSLSIVSSRYAKRVKRIQNTYCQALTDAINLMLLDAELDSYVNKFTIRMQAPVTREEIDRKESTANELQISRDIMDLISNLDNSDPYILIKLQILKGLLQNIIVDPEILALIQKEIEKIEAGLENTEETTSSGEETSLGGGDFSNIGSDLSTDAGLDQALGLEGEEEVEEVNAEENPLPNPDELGIGDLTDNNNPQI